MSDMAPGISLEFWDRQPGNTLEKQNIPEHQPEGTYHPNRFPLFTSITLRQFKAHGKNIGSICFYRKPLRYCRFKNGTKANAPNGKKTALAIGFFCAGTPSTRGILELLKSNEIDPASISEFRYRGMGWPGMATAEPADPDIIYRSQKNLLGKRQAIWGRLLAMKLLGIPRPELKGFHLFENWMDLPVKEKVRSVLGTMRRILQRV
jgi:hypothetical protein